MSFSSSSPSLVPLGWRPESSACSPSSATPPVAVGCRRPTKSAPVVALKVALQVVLREALALKREDAAVVRVVLQQPAQLLRPRMHKQTHSRVRKLAASKKEAQGLELHRSLHHLHLRLARAARTKARRGPRAERRRRWGRR